MYKRQAYNYASGDQQRRHAAFVFGCGVSLGFALLCLVVYEIFAPALTGLFIADARTIEYSAAFLRIMVVAMPMMSVCYPMIVQFQAMGRVKESLVCSISVSYTHLRAIRGARRAKPPRAGAAP